MIRRTNWDAALVLAAVVCGGVSRPATAAEEGGEKKAVYVAALALVRQLGDEQFSAREAATEKLIKIGLPATSALEEGRKDADREIRYRSERVLSIVREMDFQQRLDAFARGRGDEDYGLPGWDRFRKALGDSSELRSLFVEMQKYEPEAMQALEEGPKAAAELLNLRTTQLQLSMQLYRHQLTLGNIAALILLAGDDEVTVSQQASQSLYSFCYQQSFRTAVQNGPKTNAMRKLLGNWIRRGEGFSAYQGLGLAMQYDLKEGLIPAEKELRNRGNQAHITQYAILTLAKLGDESHVPLLETALDDTTRCTMMRINNRNYETQVRDIALAALLHVTKQDPKTYGFDRLQTHPQIVFNTTTVGFESDTERNEALAKWKTFQESRAKKEN
jgi:hypothetical protein